MAAGSFALIAGSGQAIPTTSWADIDMGSIDTDDDSILSESAGEFTPQAEGYYFILAEAQHQITHNNRHNAEFKVQRNGSDYAGSVNSGYARNNNNDLSWYQPFMIAHFNGSTDSFTVQHRRETGDGTPAGTYDWTRAKVIQLTAGTASSTPYGHYGTPTTATLGGTTATAVSGWDDITETDTATIELQAGGTDIRLKDDTLVYLLAYGLPFTGTGNARTGRLSDVTLAGTRVNHSFGHEYRRDSGTSYCAPSGLACLKPSAANQDVNIRAWGHTNPGWGTWTDGATCELDSAAGRAGVMVIGLPSSVAAAVFEDTTGGETWNGATDLALAVADAAVGSTPAEFTRDSDTQVHVNGGTDIFAYAAVVAERHTSSGTRSTQAVRAVVNSVEMTTATEMGDYLRGDQGSADHYNCAIGVGYVGSVSDGHTIQFEKFDPGTDDGNNDSVWAAGSFFIDLATLSSSGTHVTGTAAVTATGDVQAVGDVVAVGSAVVAGTDSVDVVAGSVIIGTAAATGTGAVAATGSAALGGTALVAATGTVAATGHPVVTGTATVTGTGTVAASGVAVIDGASAAPGSGTVAATGQPVRLGVAAVDGSGAVAASGFNVLGGSATASGSAAVAATGVVTIDGAATATGTGSVASSGVAVIDSTATATATGSVAASGAPVLVGTATVTATGVVVATGDNNGGTVEGSAAAVGTGSVSAAAVLVVRHGTGTVSSTAAVAATGHPVAIGTAQVAGSGSVGAASLVIVDGAATATGTGTVAATGVVPSSATAAVAGTGTVAATGVVVRGGTGQVDANAAITATGAPVTTGGSAAAAITGTGTVAASGTVIREAFVQLSYHASVLVIASAIDTSGTATVTGTGTVGAVGHVPRTGTAQVAATGTVAATGHAVHGTTAVVTGTATVTGSGVAVIDGTASSTATGTVAAAGVSLIDGTATVAATGSVTVSILEKIFVTVETEPLNYVVTATSDQPLNTVTADADPAAAVTAAHWS